MTKIKLDPYDYQLEDFKYLLHKQKGALLHDPGVGKTFGALLLITYVLETEGGKALVIVPPILLDTWYDKIYEYFDTNLKALKYKGTIKQRSKLNIEAHNIVIISYDLVVRDYEKLKKFPWNIVTIDESKNVKIGEVKRSTSTGRMNRFGVVQALAFKAKYVTVMNGTPLTKDPRDLFHIFQLIKPAVYVTKKNFERIHVIRGKGKDGFPLITGWRRLTELGNMLNKFSRRLLKKDVLKDLPKKRLIIKQFSLAEKHEKNLRELISFGFLELKDVSKELVYLQGSALMMEARRAMFNPKLVDSKEPSAYLEVLSNLIDDLGTEQFILFGHFHANMDLMKELLINKKITFTELHGRVSAKKKDEAVRLFKSKKVQCLLANPKSAGVGLDLQQAHNVIFAELDHEVDGFFQGQDRVHRPGQTEEVNIFVLIAKNTPAVALFRGIKTNIDFIKQVLSGKEEVSVFFDNRITEKEIREWTHL